MEKPTDLNELFLLHQLALIAILDNEAPETRVAAEREADGFAAKISELTPKSTSDRVVLSSHTFKSLSNIHQEAMPSH